MPSPDPGLRRFPWEAALLLALAVGAVVFQLWLPTRLPRESDYAGVARRLEAQLRPGDVLLLQPWWTERFRLLAPERLPVVGYLGSDADPLVDFRRIWVLAQPQLPYAGAARFQAQFLPGRTRLQGPERFGPLELSLFDNGRFEPTVFRASDALAGAQVFVSQGSEQSPCVPTRDGGFDCPASVRVAAGWHELFYAPRHCIALEPTGGSSRLTLRFAGVPATTALVLEAGIVWEHAAKHDPGMTPLTVGLQVAGQPQPLATLAIPLGKEGMQAVRIPGQGGTLELWVESPNRQHRQACVELRAITPGAP